MNYVQNKIQHKIKNNEYSQINNIKVSRRDALSTAGKAVAGIAALVIIGGVAYTMSIPSNNNVTQTQNNAKSMLSGTIHIDGSSTVFPITEAVAEEFGKVYPYVRVNVGVSGTGGGFKRFTAGGTVISNASRPIKDQEVQAAKDNGINFIELSVSLDGLAIIANKDNDWLDYLTTDELHLIWDTDSTVTKWSDVRSNWPDVKMNLYGPGTDSGTFDYFTEVINGDSGVSRADYTASEDDNVLVQGVSGDKGGLGYFGYAYYAQNVDKLKIVPIDSGNGPVTPSDETINTGEYSPLSRPLSIYVNVEALQRPEVYEFIIFYMNNGEVLSKEVGYTPLPKSEYEENKLFVESLI